MAEYIDLDTPLELKVAWGATYKPHTSTLRELLDVNHIPYTAAAVRPVVRGKWISHDFVAMDKGRYTGSVECSACGRFLPLPENFCPNCGADMMEGS